MMNCHSELNVNGISHMAERGGAPMSTECALSVHEYLVYTKSSYGYSHFLPQLQVGTTKAALQKKEQLTGLGKCVPDRHEYLQLGNTGS